MRVLVLYCRLGMLLQTHRQVCSPCKCLHIMQQSLYGLLQSSCMCGAQMLSKSEVEWVNNYHKEVWEKASPRMSGEVLEWLRENTAPLEVPTPQVAAMA